MRGEMTHPDTDVLAEFRAGLITGRRSARIAAHLAGCDRCAVLGDKLAAVTALLAAVPAPVMPKSVAQRLEVALAEEVAKKDDPERSGSAVRGHLERTSTRLGTVASGWWRCACSPLRRPPSCWPQADTA